MKVRHSDNENLFFGPFEILGTSLENHAKSVDYSHVICYTGTSTSITLTGQTTVAVYQQALFAITYINTANEPTRNPPRRVEMQVFDGQFFSNIATGYINISLVNDNRLMLLCGGGLPMLTEGSTTPLPIASSLTVSDLDADHMLSSANVILENAQTGDEIQVNESVSGELIVEQSSGVLIAISGQGMAAQYQVRNHDY